LLHVEISAQTGNWSRPLEKPGENGDVCIRNFGNIFVIFNITLGFYWSRDDGVAVA